jgi:transforming growth factor-beta-induced protein
MFFKSTLFRYIQKRYQVRVYGAAGGLSMKLTNLKNVKGLVVLVAALFLISCGSSDHNPPAAQQPTMNIVEIAIDDGNFTNLVAALQAADLDDDLAGTGPFTVFAPTDDAFALLPAGTLTFLLDPVNKATLIDILTYHVIDGQVSSSDALNLDGKSSVMLNALNVRIDVDNGALILNLNGNRQATVTVTDIAATNGVIHVIDAVLDPGDAVENIVDTAVANGSFTTLVTALQAADLDDDLEGPGPFTVFAPTDDAFDALEALSPGTIAFLLDPANKATLIDILTYHVFNGSVLSPAAIALDGQSVTMLNGGSMAIDVAASELVLNLGGNRQATVTITDVLCSNGVIHVIDAVLDPADSP